jgi:hypothetical protein
MLSHAVALASGKLTHDRTGGQPIPRKSLCLGWVPRHRRAILTQQVPESPNADIVARTITSKPNALADYPRVPAERLHESQLKREHAAQRRPRRARPHNGLCHGKHELQDEPVISERCLRTHLGAKRADRPGEAHRVCGLDCLQ